MRNLSDSTALTPTNDDAWDTADWSSNPVRGTSFSFNGTGNWVETFNKKPVAGEFIVFDRAEAYQFLKKDCPAQWVVRQPGADKPEMPDCPEETWPIGLSGQPECPWKYTYFIYLLNAATGETATFCTSTVGGKAAVEELTDQVQSMRRLGRNNAGALPIVELQSRLMKTKHFGSRPRPWFKITGWKFPNGEAQAAVESPKSPTAPDANAFNDSVDF